MNTSTKISAIITSGGSSTRFGSNKLLEPLGDYCVIEVTILKFLDLVDEIIIPATPETKEFIEKSKVFCPKIKFAPAGTTRQQSVYQGLIECSNPEIVLIHDGARPFIEKDIIKKAIELTYEKKAVLVGYKAIDTIKLVNDGKIVKTLDRNTIFHAQTPQCFDYKLIKKVHEQFKNDTTFTDDCSMIEHAGYTVYTLQGSRTNIKITTKDDLNFSSNV